MWSYVKTLPHLFQQGGVFYNIVKKDMGTFLEKKTIKLIKNVVACFLVILILKYLSLCYTIKM